MDVSAADAAVLATLLAPSVAALVWVGRLAARLERAERDVQRAETGDQTVGQKVHELRNWLTPLLADLQIKVAALEGFERGWAARANLPDPDAATARHRAP